MTGQYRMGARWYSPTLRTFLSRDPAGYAFSFDEWAYTVGDPWNFVDRTGWGSEDSELNAEQRSWVRRFGDALLRGAQGRAQELLDNAAALGDPDALLNAALDSIASAVEEEFNRTFAERFRDLLMDAISGGMGDPDAAWDFISAVGTAILSGDPDIVGESIGAEAVQAGLESALDALMRGRANAVGDAAEAMLESSARNNRLPQDMRVSPQPPPALTPDNRTVGRTRSQNDAVQQRVADLKDEGARDIRVNQQQVNADGERVGINRPDLQYTDAEGNRHYVEYDRSDSERGPQHENRILVNDPDGTVELITMDEYDE